MALLWQRQEAEDTPYEWLWIRTMLMTVLLANTPAQAEFLLYSLERAEAGSIGIHVNAVKTEFMCFNQRGDISTLNGRSLKLVDKFLEAVSHLPKMTSTHDMKAWIAIDKTVGYMEVRPIR